MSNSYFFKFFIFTLFVFPFNDFALCQSIPGIFTVDYKLLLALHPSMSNFDLVLGRHLRSDVSFQDMNNLNEQNKKMNALNSQIKKKVDEIQKEIDKLLLQKGDIEKRVLGNVIEYNSEQRKYTSQETRAIQEKKISEYDKKILELESKKTELFDSVLDPLYITRQQSNDRINKALAQIDSVLQNLSRQHGGAMIIDRDFTRVMTAPKSVHQSHEAGADPLSIRVFQAILEMKLTPNIPDIYLNKPELRQLANRAKTDLEASFDKNVAAQISKSPQFNAALSQWGRFFLVGAEKADLTKLALDEIYKLNNINPDFARRIISQVRVE